MSKRAVAAMALAVGCAGAVIGFAWHAPGSSGTWADIRTWAGFAAVVIGVPVAVYQLHLQRCQLADQQAVLEGEVQRNVRRDQLLDGQLRELEQRSLVSERQQAEAVTLELVDSTDDPPTYMANITNGSKRPVRNVVCKVLLTDGQGPLAAVRRGQLADWGLRPGEVLRRIMVTSETGTNVTVLRPGLTYTFVFGSGRSEWPDARVVARFTDDAGLHWQIDHDLHLAKIADRSDW